MRKTANSRSATTDKPVATVKLKDYKILLKNAGFGKHEYLTGEGIELVESSTTVKNSSLGDAHRALEMKKKEESFERHHLSSDKLRIGVKKLTEFLYNYKDYKEQKSK